MRKYMPVAVTVAIALAIFFALNRTPSASSQITLYSPTRSYVQMFAELRDAPDVKVWKVRPDTKCTNLGGTHRIGAGDNAIYFYHLVCNGKPGYVNTQWVR